MNPEIQRQLFQCYPSTAAQRIAEDYTAVKAQEGTTFFPFRASFREGTWFCLNGSVLVETTAGATSSSSSPGIAMIPVQLTFPREYPTCAPWIQIIAPPNNMIVPNHSFLPSNGMLSSSVMRTTRNWDGTPSKKSDVLVELLLELSSLFVDEKKFPFQSLASKYQQQADATGIHTTPPPPPIPSTPHVDEEERRRRQEFDALVDKVYDEVSRQCDEAQNECETNRAVVASQLELLESSREGLERLCQRLVDHKDKLLNAVLDATAWSEAIDKVVNGPEDILANPERWPVPADENEACKLELIAVDHALEDTLDALEKLLKKNTMTCEEYLREVSETARQQYLVRGLLLKLTDDKGKGNNNNNNSDNAQTDDHSRRREFFGGETPEERFQKLVGELRREFMDVPRGTVERVLRDSRGDMDLSRAILRSTTDEYDLCS
eukprot:PhM_4_TR13734/c0_g1_i1/m.25161/K12183/TSG101, STP22, VPS23; ESCRT-I complex subunit TSG101